jgi:hypothetical protein
MARGDTDNAIPEIDISQIAGNAPDNIKLRIGNIPHNLKKNQPTSKPELNSFGRAIELRMKLTELSIINKVEEPKKLEGRAVFELDVVEGPKFNYLFKKKKTLMAHTHFLFRYGQFSWKHSWRMLGVFD